MVSLSARPPAFTDRADAGRRLAEVLVDRVDGDVIVYAIPRGGVPVALEVARALEAPLDLALARRIGAPGNLIRMGERRPVLDIAGSP